VESRRWQRVKEVFAAAVERPAAERDAYLDRACDGDPELRREVASLLDFHREPDPEPGSGAATTATEPEAGDRIGPYRLLGVIGSGGMGTVYLAERADDAFRKRVAVKVVRHGLGVGGPGAAEELARFRTERQILAALEHPNIARLLDGGTTGDGLPYLVMEHVEGEPIDRYCERRGLGLRARLELFRTVCAAVHSAHRSLVVHRDLKPSNILVTASGEPKLLDFGIAKLLDPAPAISTVALTTPSERVMTPDYASPEQVQGEPITTATDVYLLGVLLYELLTGRRPFRASGALPWELQRAICEQEPEPPSAVTGDRRLRGDLDNVVAMAMRKDPERRYASARELGEDVRRHLEGLPVAARPDTLLYRAGKLVRRHRVATAAAAAVLAALAVGMVGTLWQARVAEVERRRAERRFDDVRRLANAFLFELHDAIAPLPGSTAARELVVERGLEYLDSLAAEAGGDPALQRELAAAYERVGNVQGRPGEPNLGRLDDALGSYRKALAIRRELHRADPESVARSLELAAARDLVGDALWWSGNTPGAAYQYRAALDLRRRAAEIRPGAPEVRRALAAGHSAVGDFLAWNGEPGRALGHYRPALATLRDLLRQAPGDRELRSEVAGALLRVAEATRALGEVEEARRRIAEARDVYAELAAEEPKDARVLDSLLGAHVMMGESLLGDDPESALGSYRRAVDLARRLTAADPENVRARRLLAIGLASAGDALLRTGRPEPALGRLVEAARIQGELAADDPSNTGGLREWAITLSLLGRARLATGDAGGAVEAHRRALATLRELLAEDPENAVLHEDVTDVRSRLEAAEATRGG